MASCKILILLLYWLLLRESVWLLRILSVLWLSKLWLWLMYWWFHWRIITFLCSCVKWWVFYFMWMSVVIAVLWKLWALGIKTHGRVQASVTPHISISTGLISTKFIYFVPSIYTTLHSKFEGNGEIYVPENCPIFFTFFFFFAPFYKSNFEPTKDILLIDRFLWTLAHL